MILAIDTSTDQASVALAEGDVIRAEWSWTARGNHSRHLTRVIQELLALEEARINSVEAVIVAIGPGSFSGVRVGLSEAKGLAVARRMPLVGISTLDMIAYQASCCSQDVWAVLPAGRGQVYLAHYVGSPGDWRRDTEYTIATMTEAADRTARARFIAGSGAAPLAEELRARGHEPTLAPPAWRLRRAAFLAELGRRYLDAGGHDQVDLVEPLYLRRSAAEEKRAAMGQE